MFVARVSVLVMTNSLSLVEGGGVVLFVVGGEGGSVELLVGEGDSGAELLVTAGDGGGVELLGSFVCDSSFLCLFSLHRVHS